jgi:hypothetical protein
MLMRALHPFRDWLPGDTVDVPTDQCRDLIIAEIVEPYTPDQLADLEPDDLPAPAGEPTAAPKGFTEADNPPWQAEAFATVEDGADSPEEPLVHGAPGGPVYHVRVNSPVAGLWPGEAWITGTEADSLMATGLMHQLTP